MYGFAKTCGVTLYKRGSVGFCGVGSNKGQSYIPDSLELIRPMVKEIPAIEYCKILLLFHSAGRPS